MSKIEGVEFSYVGGELTIFTLSDGASYPLGKDHPSYGQIKKNLRTLTEDEARELLDAKKATEAFLNSGSGDGTNKATVKDGVVYYNGLQVHNAVATRIVDQMQAGLDSTNLLRFLERVDLNPSYQSAQELFDFLDRKGLPITEDGCFLAYKAVRDDFKDIYSGTIDNSPGQVVKMKRGKVDDNRNHHCSQGLHVGAMEYVRWYGSRDGRVVLVKVDPEHCVSVPNDCEYKKLRTCQYEVLSEFTGELFGAVYTSRGEEVVSPLDDEDYDWGWADNDYDEDDYDDYDEDDSFSEGDVVSETVGELEAKVEELTRQLADVKASPSYRTPNRDNW